MAEGTSVCMYAKSREAPSWHNRVMFAERWWLFVSNWFALPRECGRAVSHCPDLGESRGAVEGQSPQTCTHTHTHVQVDITAMTACPDLCGVQVACVCVCVLKCRHAGASVPSVFLKLLGFCDEISNAQNVNLIGFIMSSFNTYDSLYFSSKKDTNTSDCCLRTSTSFDVNLHPPQKATWVALCETFYLLVSECWSHGKPETYNLFLVITD